MPVEIEAKLKVDSLQEVADKLRQLGADFLQEQQQIDTYFDNADSEMATTDRCLRLRRQLTDKPESFFLTYKGPKEKDNFKKRQELETEVKDFDSTGKLLCALGYAQSLVVEKKRRVWQLGGCKVCLDELPLLGSFVEIEGPDAEKIADVQRSLDLANLTHIPQSYALLIQEKLHQH